MKRIAFLCLLITFTIGAAAQDGFDATFNLNGYGRASIFGVGLRMPCLRCFQSCRCSRL